MGTLLALSDFLPIELVRTSSCNRGASSFMASSTHVTDGNTFTVLSTNAQAIGKIVEIGAEVVGTTPALVWVDVEGVAARSL